METTYKIIGADGREYGPVSLAELKSWIHDGRIVGQTHVWRSDQTTWLPAAQYQELQPEIGQVSPVDAAALESTLEPVGFWPRFLAYIIDGTVLYGVSYIAWTWLSKLMNWQELDLRSMNLKTIADLMPVVELLLRQTIIGYFIRMIYMVALNGRFGATIGKLVIGARIVRLDGSPIGYGIAFLRFLGTLLSDWICYIGYLVVAFREDKRALHDLIVGTQVIYRR